MQSGGARAATTVIVITLVFGPVAHKNNWVYKLLRKSEYRYTAPCAPGDPCPATRVLHKRVYLPKPRTAPATVQRKTARIAPARAKQQPAKTKKTARAARGR